MCSINPLVLDELRREGDRGERRGSKIVDLHRREVSQRLKRCESLGEGEEEKKRRKRQSLGLVELEEEGEDEDLVEGYSEDKETWNEIIDLPCSTLERTKPDTKENKNEAGMSSAASRREVYRTKVESDTDDEDQVELVFIRRTQPNTWSRAASGVVTSAGDSRLPKNRRGSVWSRSSIGSNIGGISGASRASFSQRGSICETVAAITAHRSSLSSGSLLLARANAKPGAIRSGNASAAVGLGRQPSTATNRPQYRRGSGLSISSLGVSSNLGSIGLSNTTKTGGLSLDSSDDFKCAISGSVDKESSKSINGNERQNDRTQKNERLRRIVASEDEKFDEESCDGVVTRLIDRGTPLQRDERSKGSRISSNMMRCASWVSTKVSLPNFRFYC